MPAPRRGGVGSNQYQTRPGAPAALATDDRAQIEQALTDNEEAELVGVAFTEDGIEAWERWGATPTETIAWSRAGFRANEALHWIAYGHTDPTAVQGHDPWRAEFIPPGIPHDDIEPWFDHIPTGVLDSWISSGWTPEKAGAWYQAGFACPAEAEAYAAEFGWTTDNADIETCQKQLETCLNRAGWLNPHNRDNDRGWLGSGQHARRAGLFNEHDLSRWIAVSAEHEDDASDERFEPAEAALLHNAGVDPDFAVAAYDMLGYGSAYSEQQAKIIARLWASGHRDGTAAANEFSRTWHSGTNGSIMECAAAGMTPSERKEWCGVPSGADALTPEAAAWWWSNGFDKATAQLWEPYCQRSRSTRRIAAYLIAKGIGPEGLAE